MVLIQRNNLHLREVYPVSCLLQICNSLEPLLFGRQVTDTSLNRTAFRVIFSQLCSKSGCGCRRGVEVHIFLLSYGQF